MLYSSRCFGGRLVRAFGIVVSFLLPGEAMPQEVQGPLPASRLLATASAALADGRAEQAAALLRAATRPDDEDAAAAFYFALGLAELRSGSPDASVRALREALDLRPDLAGARRALAQAYRTIGDSEKSELHLRRALASVPDDERRRFIEQDIAALRSGRAVTASLSIAVAPDTNIGAQTSASAVMIDGVPFQLSEDARKKSGVGLIVTGTVSAFTELTDGVRFVASASLYNTDYAGTQFDDLLIRLRAGPEFTLANGILTFGPVAYRRWYGGDEYSISTGLFADFFQPIGQQFVLGLGTEFYRSWFEEFSHLNSDFGRIDMTLGWVLTPRVRLRASAGLGREVAQFSAYSSWQQRVGAGLSFDLWEGFGLAPSHTVSWREFDERQFYEAQPRSDRRHTSRLELSNRRLEFAGMMPTLAVVHEVQFSSTQLHAYDRIRLEIGFTREF